MLSSNMQIAKLNKFVDIWYMVEYLKDNTNYYLYDTKIMLIITFKNILLLFIYVIMCIYVYVWVYLCMCRCP